MKKVVVIILLLAVVGAGTFFFLKGKKDEEANKDETKVEKHWNIYATEDNHLVTLNDRMATVAGGSHIAKFTMTIKFKNEHGYEKFMGHSHPLTEEEKEAEAEGGHGGGDEEAHISPMNVKINSLVSDFMMNLGTEEAKNVKYIEDNMKNYLNENLKLEKDLIEEVYIEQYVFN